MAPKTTGPIDPQYLHLEPGDWSNFANRYRRTHDVGTVCRICGLEEFARRTHKHHLDHCHRTGRVRGLLCQGCNLHLGRWEQKQSQLRQYLVAADNTPMVYGSNQMGRKQERLTYRLSRPQLCDSCGAPPKVRSLCVDHCHQQMIFRGLLCIPCNVTLGWYEKYAAAVDTYMSGKDWTNDFFKVRQPASTLGK